ncbi:MAG: MFS transporter [Actinomycetota bacterium]|nr:MFS transporter [Actinomycetota bacterium]
MEGTLGRAREALRSPDFTRLFAIRLVSQFADGLFQAALVASVVFFPEQTTAAGFAKATIVVSVPFSVIGPFTGVFIDRWSRRRILVRSPWLRVVAVPLVLFDPLHAAVPFFAGALLVLSVNRFFLATAQAVVPRLVPTEDLLIANSMATVGGTVALLAGVFAGGQVAGPFGLVPLVIGSAGLWAISSGIAARIRSDLTPRRLDFAPLRSELRRVRTEFADGITRLVRTPRAIGPIASITLDQMGQGLVLVISLVFFRERFREGVGSFSWLIAAGGVGVLAGLVSVGALESRFPKERIVAGSFVLGGLALVLVSTAIGPVTVLVASFIVGLTFSWKKVPVDTMVQEAVPDAYRGRVFAVYDVSYNLSRVAAALIAVPLLPAIGDAWSVAAVGLLFIAWAPVLPRWVARAPEIELEFYAGGRADEVPRAIRWGGVRERVTVERSWVEERNGERFVCFRLALEDGTGLDVRRRDTEDRWHLERELGS